MKRSRHPLFQDFEDTLKDCEVTRTRRSGPGGQHRNKVESAIVITHRPTGVRAEANERRSQHENMNEARLRLRVNLALAIRSEVHDDYADPIWRSRLRGKKISVNPNHEDFPLLLAHALNWLDHCEYEIGQAADVLDTTSSQLTRFLKWEPRALNLVNQQRKAIGKRPYR